MPAIREIQVDRAEFGRGAIDQTLDDLLVGDITADRDRTRTDRTGHARNGFRIEVGEHPRAPSATSRRASAAPMPAPAPVTIATLPEISMSAP